MPKWYIVIVFFNLYAEYTMQNAGWMTRKLESRFLGETSKIYVGYTYKR